MGNLLEKITLYDILGYTIPGCVLLLLLSGIDTEYISGVFAEWGDYKGALYFVFFLAAYLCGIILSEVTDMVLAIRKKGKPSSYAEWEQDTVLSGQVARALKESGYCEVEGAETEEKIAENIAAYGMQKYMGYIYGSVQAGAEYKRIHDYASAYLLYKNLAMAVAIGTVALFVSAGWNCGILIMGVILTALLVKRSVRFYHIKNKYAVVWFINKMRTAARSFS